MSLNINPYAQVVGKVAAQVGQAVSDGGGTVAAAGDALGKAKLDSIVAKAAGDLGSGLNFAAGEFDLSNTIGDTAGLGTTVQNALGNADLSSLASNAAAVSNVTADISNSLSKISGGSLASGLQSLAGQISSAAGVINNILSLKRGANLPANAELFQTRGEAIKLNPGSKNDWRVRLTAQWSIFKSPLFMMLERTGGVVWPYTPQITFTSKANYNTLESVHSNYPFYSYKNSAIEDITISGEFSAENSYDAAYWIAATTFLKTATKMFFGTGENAGNPPIVCNLTGYGASIFDRVPVIVKNFTVDLADDVNYVRCDAFNTSTWVPIMSNISVTVAPIYNRRNLRKFSLEQYARGSMTSGDGVGYI